MSLLTKGLVYAAFVAFVLTILSLLGTCETLGIPALITGSLTLIFGYLFAWASVFTVINTLLFCATTIMALDLILWLWGVIRGVIGWIARMIG